MLQEIRNRLKVVPFQPFEIRCTNGDVWRVEHPENAAVVKHTVLVAHPDCESAITLSASHIVGVLGMDEPVMA